MTDKRPTGPPYSSRVGTVPERPGLVDEHLRAHETALLAGPRNRLFTQALIGEPGVGKSVHLSVLAERMHDAHHWVTVEYRANPSANAIGDILAEVPDAARGLMRRWHMSSLEKEVKVELNAGVAKVSLGARDHGEHHSERSHRMALARALEKVGTAAEKKHRGVLIAVDEAHNLSESDLRDLGTLVESVGTRLPVAVALAGRPELSAMLRHADSSALRQLPQTEIGMLSEPQTAWTLANPARARGVDWDRDALAAAHEMTGGHPLLVQLLGERAWELARPEAGSRITLEDVIAARPEVQATAGRIHDYGWDRIGLEQRSELPAVPEPESPVHRVVRELSPAPEAQVPDREQPAVQRRQPQGLPQPGGGPARPRPERASPERASPERARPPAREHTPPLPAPPLTIDRNQGLDL